MANTTIKITQLPSIGNGLSASTILPVVNTTGTATTDKVSVGNVANYILTEAGNTLEPAYLSTIAYSVANAAQPNITSVGTLSVNTLKISGGTNGYILQTDGAGNLTWVAGTGSGNGEVGGANGQIQFNNAGNFGGDADLTWDAGNNKLITANLSASGNANVGNLNATNVNVTGNVRPNAIYTDHYYYANGYVFGGGGGNGVPGGVTTQVQFNDSGAFAGNTGFTFNKTSGLLSATLFAGGGNGLANIQGANVTGFVPNANVANTAFAVAGANVTGAVSYAGTANSVAVANVVGIGNIATIALSGSSSNVLYGNGVFAPIASTYGNSNVANYLPTYTGNLSGNSLTVQQDVSGNGALRLQGIANGNSTINIGGEADIDLSANVGNINLYTSNNQPWIFDQDGNLTLPGNTFAVNYANGTPVPLGGSGNTGNVTFDNVTVQGVSGFGLQLSPSPDDTANSKYLQVRAGDVDSHIHFDTGDNAIYDQYFGDDNKYLKLEAGTSGNIIIGTDNNGKNWTFGDNGNLSVPGSITSILSGGFPFGASITNVTTGNPTVVVTIDGAVFPDPVTGRVIITGVQGATEANGTRYYQAVNEDQFQLFNDAACTIPTSGIGWGTYTTGGFAYSPEYNDLELKGDNVKIRTGDSIFQFTPTGDIQMPGGAYASGGYGRLLTNNGYTTLLSYGTDAEHGGPELDWSDATDPANVFGNSNVLRNTLYLNDGGLYVGLNQNYSANAVNAFLRFNQYGALIIPEGSANTVSKGQILSNNENGFINLDVQFGVDPGLEGGVRLGTGASKPVDVRAGTNEWRFDSDGSLTVPGVIKSIGSYTYRGFYAVLNQISGDDPSINQIVLSRSSSISGSNPTTDTDDDNFIVTGINGSNITAIINLYGQSTSVPLDTESIFSFIRNYIDVVLYNGNTQRTSISDIRIAFEVNESALLGTENFAPGTIVDNMNFNSIQAIVPASDGTTTGTGTGAVFLFDVDEPIGVIDYNTVSWNYSRAVVPGTGYTIGEQITLPGTTLGGAAPADNMTITVDGIDGSGGITSFSTTGTMSQSSYAQCIVKHYIYDGASDIYDQGNFLGTDISRCVFTAYTDSNANLVVTSIDSGALYPWMTFYEPTNQTYPMVVWQTAGSTEGGTGTYVTGGYDTIGTNLPSRTYTAYGMYYGVGETVTGTNENWGGGTYGSMVGNEGNGIFSMVCLDGTASTVSYAGNTGSDSDGTKAAISQFAIGAEAQPLNLVSNNNTWAFGTNGNLVVPGNINAASTGSFSINDVISAITTGSANVYVTLPNTVFPGPVTGKVAISGVVGAVEANQTWWFQASDSNEIQLFTDSALTTPANGTTWLTYLGGGTAASVTYDNLVIGAGVLTLGNPNRQWTIYEDGNLVATHNTASIIGSNGLAVEVAPGNSLTNVINVPVDQTFTTAWASATYSNNSGTGRIDIVDAYGTLRRFVQLYFQNANSGTALVTINDSANSLSYNGFEYIGNTFTIYVAQSPGVTPITVTTMRLDAVMRNVMELNDDNNQLNIESYSGWSVNITSGYQGDVNINAGDDIFINAGNKTTSDSTGGQLGFNGGNGGDADTQDPGGHGGGIDMVAGDGGVASNSYGAGNGGYTFVSGGNGGGANATGSHNAGIGGSLVLYAGNAGGNDGNISLGQEGGNVEIQAGSASGGLDGGYVSITAGQGGIGYGSGNIRLTTQNDGHDTNYNLVLDNTGNLTLPTIITGEGTDEQAIVRSQRKIIPALHYSAAINGSTPTVVYTASSSNISSLKMTISMTHGGLGQEMFDISAISAGANVLYSVSNRLNGTGQPDTTVSVDYAGGGPVYLAVTLTVNSGATTSWVTYDSTEFGYQVD